MKLTSRPAVKQDCEDIVLQSLKQLYLPGRTLPGYITPSLADYGNAVHLIMGTLQRAGTIKTFQVKDPQELAGSTYTEEKWKQSISFSGDGKHSYTVRLDYNFKRAA